MKKNEKADVGFNTCDSCGVRSVSTCRIGAWTLCKKCSSGVCKEEALLIAKNKHREKLKKILEELNKD